MPANPAKNPALALAIVFALASGAPATSADDVKDWIDDPPVKCKGYYDSEYGPDLGAMCSRFNRDLEILWQDVDPASHYPGLQVDEDGDRLGDAWANFYGVLQAAMDPDGDGLTNEEEFWWLTNPFVADSDGDGWSDGTEADYWGGTSGGAVPGYAYSGSGATLDTDGDQVPNMWDGDSDNDGLLDGAEESYGARAELRDTDGDGLIDGGVTFQLEYLPGEVHDHGTRPAAQDSDADFVQDTEEVQYWQGRGYASMMDLDSDGDGWINVLDADSDNDGLLDGDEVHAYHTDPADWDTDGDALPDGWEVDGNLNPLVNDAALDPDADGLANLGE